MKNSAIPFSTEMQELLLEAPVLISIAAAEQDRKKKERFKKAAHQFFYAETFDGLQELEEKISRAEPFFDEMFERIDRILPVDQGAKNTTIRLWISEIVNNDHSFTSTEMAYWKEKLVKFGIYLTRSEEQMSDKHIAPLMTIIQRPDGKMNLETLLGFKN